jgi:hypothetical protein
VIRGYFDAITPTRAHILARVVVSVRLSGPGLPTRPVAIPFVIDTGAGETNIHPMDAIGRLRLPEDQLKNPQAWPHREIRSGVGGRAMYFPVPAEYVFVDTTGVTHSLPGEVRIAKSEPNNQQLESLLGWDVLQHVGLLVDWPSQRVELHPTGQGWP